MKRIIAITLMFIFLVVFPAFSGSMRQSEYDVVWKITIIDCKGNTIVYNDCRITNAGQFWISFMPDQGLIPSGNGKEIQINTGNGCVTIIKEQVN